MAPEHKRLNRYPTMTLREICSIPVESIVNESAHLYLWVPNALLPDEQYELIESCSWGPYIEMFARGKRKGWSCWGNQAEDYTPDWNTYSNHSQAEKDKKECVLGLFDRSAV